MNTSYLCFIVPLLIATLILLVMVLWEHRHERTIKAQARVLVALLVSLVVTTIIMLTSDVEDIPSLCCGIMAFFLFFFLVGLCSVLSDYKNKGLSRKVGSILNVLLMVFLAATIIIILTGEMQYILFVYCGSMTVLLYFFLLGLFGIRMSSKHNGLSEKAGSILVVMLVVFLAAAITSWNNIDIEEVHYQVSVVVENETGPPEVVVLYIPIPNGYPGDFFAFPGRNRSVISTEHGRMLSLSTSTNLTLKTTLKDDRSFRAYLKYAPHDEPDLTTRSGNQVYFFLQNTSCNVSVNLFFMTKVTERYYYMAVGGILDSEVSSKSPKPPWPWYPGHQMVRLSPGWNEIELLRGEALWD